MEAGAPHRGSSARRFEGSAGRQFSQTGASGPYSSTYDPAGRQTRLTHPDGFFVQQDYLVTGEMERIRERDGTSDSAAESGAGVVATNERDRLVLGNVAVTG